MFGNITNEDVIQDRNDNKKRFMSLSVFWLRLDQIEEIMARDYLQIFKLYDSQGILNIDLDYEAPAEPLLPVTKAPILGPPPGINLPLKLKVKLMSKLTTKLW